MMINTKKMKNDLLLYSKLISEYENAYLNYYNIFSSFSVFWKDTKSKKFFDSGLLEKRDCLIMLEEFIEFKEIYNFIFTKCSSIGEIICIDLKKEDIILAKFDNYIKKAKNILLLFNEINVSNVQYKLVWNQRKKLEKIIEEMQKNKNVIQNIFKKMYEIEEKINNKLNKFDITLIKETDISRMV